MYARFAGKAIAPYPLVSFTGGTRAKASQLFLLGRQVGRLTENVNRELQEMGFLSEMFFAQTSKLKPGQRPRNTPSRKEGLLWLSVSGLPPFDAEVAVYELKRRSGKVSGLAPVEVAVRLEEIILYGFIAGVRSCQLTDEQLPDLLDIRSFLK